MCMYALYVCRKYLPNADREHLLAGDCPFSHLSGNAVVVIYDANSSDPENLSASRLTTNVTTGDQIPVRPFNEQYCFPLF